MSTHLLGHALLPRDEQIELARKAQQGDKRAKDRLVRHHQRTVRKVALKHQNLGLELEDLVSEGNIGLLKGLERFNPDSGNSVNTYCSWWISHEIKRAISGTGSMIRKPNRLVDKAGLMWGVMGRIQTAIGHEPDNEEIAHALNIQGRVYSDKDKRPFTPEDIAHLKDIFRYTVSTDARMPNEEGDEPTYSNGLWADDDTEAEVLKTLDAEEVRELVASLPKRHGDILARRYGIVGEPATFRAVGEEFGISSQRTQQIILKAKNVLRERVAS